MPITTEKSSVSINKKFMKIVRARCAAADRGNLSAYTERAYRAEMLLAKQQQERDARRQRKHPEELAA